MSVLVDVYCEGDGDAIRIDIICFCNTGQHLTRIGGLFTKLDAAHSSVAQISNAHSFDTR